MNIYDRKALKAYAEDSLHQAPQAQRIVLLWACVSSGLSLLVSFLTFLLDSQIELTGGLSGIGLRSFLSTAQSFLRILNFVLIPFWNMGYLSCVLRFSKREQAEPGHLLDGFRRFGPVLRLMVLRYLLYLLLAFVSMYLGVMVLSMTALGTPLYEFIESNSSALDTGVLSDDQMLAMTQASIPLLIGSLVLFVLAAIPVSYRLRLADFRIMDEPRCRARMALLESNRLMRRSCIALFRLDLSFWWYFLGTILAAVLCYGDMILPALGIVLPFGSDFAFFLFYILGLGAQTLILWAFGNRVQTAYAVFYRTLCAPAPESSPMMSNPESGL